MANTTTETIKNSASNLGSSVGSSVKNSLDKSSLKSAQNSVEKAAYSLSDVAGDIAHQGYDMIADRARMASDIAEKAYEGGVDFVKKNPGKALVGAAAIGFLAAAFLRRRR